MEGLYDATLAVIADEQVRRERAASRGHALEDARAARQLSQEEKARQGDVRVRNDGSEGTWRHSCRPSLTILDDEPSPRRRYRAAPAAAPYIARTAARGRGRAGRRRGGRWSRGPGAMLVVVVALGALAIAFGSRLDHTVRRLALPLKRQAIREQAAAKHLDPALIAAVIYAETKFDPRTSAAGAEGLMQIEPATAEFLAKLSGGYRFQTSDLATPSVNVAYGSYYLRYLLDHYADDEMLAVAAYNAGLANVDRWVQQAHAEGRSLTVGRIPFGQTRAYVQRVLQAQREYRTLYGRQLGIS